MLRGMRYKKNFHFVTKDKYDQAEPMYKRAQDILEKSLGPDHPEVATALSNRAELLYAQVRIVRNIVGTKLLSLVNSRTCSTVVGKRKNDAPGCTLIASRLFALSPRCSEALVDDSGRNLMRLHDSFSTVCSTTLPHCPLACRGKLKEADPLCLRAVQSGEHTVGPDHPDLAARFNVFVEHLTLGPYLYRRHLIRIAVVFALLGEV